MAKIKRISIKEFRALGYLQEVNRLFLHPLGLALDVKIDEDGTETLGDVWDARDNPEGILFAFDDPNFSSQQRLSNAKQKAMYILEQQRDRRKARKKARGFWIEPIADTMQR